MEGSVALYFLGAVLVGVVAYTLLRPGQSGGGVKNQPTPKGKRGRSPSAAGRTTAKRTYHSVSIAIPWNKRACEAARQARHLRFLSDKAPTLPLPGCDAAQCFCVYRHHSDRRTGEDRRSPLVGHVVKGSVEERRISRGRRELDYQSE